MYSFCGRRREPPRVFPATRIFLEARLFFAAHQACINRAPRATEGLKSANAVNVRLAPPINNSPSNQSPTPAKAFFIPVNAFQAAANRTPHQRHPIAAQMPCFHAPRLSGAAMVRPPVSPPTANNAV